jgi:hypothetical protein
MGHDQDQVLAIHLDLWSVFRLLAMALYPMDQNLSSLTTGHRYSTKVPKLFSFPHD